MARSQARRGLFAIVNLLALTVAAGILWFALSGESGRLAWSHASAEPGRPSDEWRNVPLPTPTSSEAVVRLVMPTIEVDAPVVEMGLGVDRQMEIPDRPDVVAWYGFTAQPGTHGNAVLAGHVNWRDGSDAALTALNDIAIGDELLLVRQDQQELRYVVTARESVDIRVTSASAVIADTDGETVTLLTCHGEFDRGMGQYRERLVVRAERVS